MLAHAPHCITFTSCVAVRQSAAFFNGELCPSRYEWRRSYCFLAFLKFVYWFFIHTSHKATERNYLFCSCGPRQVMKRAGRDVHFNIYSSSLPTRMPLSNDLPYLVCIPRRGSQRSDLWKIPPCWSRMRRTTRQDCMLCCIESHFSMWKGFRLSFVALKWKPKRKMKTIYQKVCSGV